MTAKRSQSFTTTWIVNNTIGIFFGFVIISLVGILYTVLLSINISFQFVAIAVILAGLLQGLIMGEWQYRALVQKIPKINKTKWLALTASTTVFIWVCVIIFPQLKNYSLVSMQESVQNQTKVLYQVQPNLVAIYNLIISFFGGIFLGYILSFVQWTELSKHTKASFRWIYYHALAWGAGLGFIATLISTLSYSSVLAFIIKIAIVYLIGSFLISAISLFAVLYLKSTK